MFTSESDPISGRIERDRQDRLFRDGQRVNELRLRQLVDEENSVGESRHQDVRHAIEVGGRHVRLDVLESLRLFVVDVALHVVVCRHRVAEVVTRQTFVVQFGILRRLKTRHFKIQIQNLYRKAT